MCKMRLSPYFSPFFVAVFFVLEIACNCVYFLAAAIPDDVLAGWIESLNKVYSIIGGYPTSDFSILLLVCL